MTSLMEVYGAFLAKVNEDDWAGDYSEEDLEWFLKDWRSILDSALPYFRFPRCSLEIDEENQSFKSTLGDEEIQVIATYMKAEWLKRTVDSWENIKAQYDEADFSAANLLKTFISLKDQVSENARKLEAIYSRSINRRPYNYRKLAGGGGHHGQKPRH